MSDADLELFKQSLPRIINQPGGNQMIIDTLRAVAEYDAQGAGIVQRLRNGEISRSEAFQELQGRANPLEGLRVPDAPAQTSGGIPPVPGGAGMSQQEWEDLWETLTDEEKAAFQ